jgi:hypothetical protein
MRKRGTVNRKDTAKMRGRKMLRRVRRSATYTIVSSDGRVMRGRVLMRDGTLALVRII